MTEKRNIAKDDIYLEARLRAEGARVVVRNALPNANAYQAVVMDGCDIVVGLWNNSSSRLDVVFDGEDVTISEMGEVLATGTPETRPSWRDFSLSDGSTVQDVTSWNADIASIFLHQQCLHAVDGNACKYCVVSARPDGVMPYASPDLSAAKARQVEAIIIALQNGWRGNIRFTGGTPPASRHDHLTDEIEKILTQIRDAVGDEVLAENHVLEGFFAPPEDLTLLERWRDIGLNATEFDTQVVHPDYFKAICPGRGEQSRWIEAQCASAEVFGRGRGAATGIVMGIEPMAGLLEGIEERIERGVFTQLFTFIPIPGTMMGGMRPPSAAWYVEASEKIADIYLRYADTFDVNLTEDSRFGYTRKGRSFYLSIVDDEMSRRLQEMGKLPPGLPQQDGAGPTVTH